MPHVLNKLRIGTKIGASVALGVAIFSALGIIFYRSANQIVKTSKLEAHTYEVLAKVEDLASTLKDAETGQRGYLITGQASFLEPYNLAVPTVVEKIQTVRQLTVDNPSQQQRINEAENLIAAKLAEMKRVIEVRQTRGTKAAVQVIQAGRGKKLMDEIRQSLNQVKTAELDLLQERSAAANAASQRMVVSLVLGTPLYAIALALIGFFLTRNISKPLRELSVAAQKVADGDLSTIVSDDDRGDEVGTLAQAFNQMIANLRRSTLKSNEQDWLKTNLAQFNRMMQGQRDLEAVSQMLLSELAPLVQAQQGVFYLMHTEDSQPYLKLLGTYAYQERKHLANRFRLGEGLVGQCALEKQRILLTNVPEDYIKISSGLGESKPLNIAVLPAVFENQVIAVIELASFQPFETIHLAFLDQLTESVAIVLNAIIANLKTEQLLKQSQLLTEELQTQQEELTESNQRLEQQTRSLRLSEEQLKSQQDELKQSNDSLMQLNEELEEKTELLALQNREVERKNEEIERSRLSLEDKAEQLELSSRYKSEFLANMSHELRTPLNSLLILSRLLGENSDSNLTAKQVEYAQTIYSSGSDLLTLINDILDLSKIEAGMMSVEVESLPFTALQTQIEHTFREVARNKGLDFNIHLDPQLPQALNTDPKQLQQVLKNLLANAFKFTEQGQVQLEIKVATDGWRLDHTSLNQANCVIAFAVSDTGIGIAPANQRVVFEAFQQADGTTSRRYGGTGLGLSISRKIAELLGGEICLQSELGQGSTFTLYVPQSYPSLEDTGAIPEYREIGIRTNTVLDSAAPPLPALASNLPVHAEIHDDRDSILRGDRVLLIVEDDVSFAKILLDVVRQQGFKGLVATRGQIGLMMAQEFHPVAIMLDIRLPDMEGWAVLDRLKHTPATRHIPVHVMSVEEGQKRSLQQGAIAFLQKPIMPETLQQALTGIKGFVERSVKKLLVVEDDPIQQRSIVELIGNGDVASTAVSTGAEALQVLDTERFDCMVLDLGLPDMSGFDLIEQIKQQPALGYLPIIVYTGKELTPQEETTLRRLSDSIIVKDVQSPERLLDETALFLHRVQANLPAPKQQMLEKLKQSDPILTDRKVLIVDDDVRNLFALTSLLERYQMQVLYAENGRDGIATLQANPDVKVVLMDVMMPEMDGYEAMRTIRQIDAFRTLPVIALTAKAMKDDRDKCIEAGASDYITKPVDTEQLLSLLRVWLYR